MSIYFQRCLGVLAMMVAIGVCLTSRCIATEQRLADLSYLRHHSEAGTVEIETSGTTRLRLSFPTPTMARVQIAPQGTFTANLSPAVASPPLNLSRFRILNQDKTLVIKTSGISLHIDKQHLQVTAYTPDDKHLLSQESPNDGTSWDTASGSLSQTRILSEDEHIYGLGEDNANRGTLDRRGTIRALWTGQQINSGNVTADFPVPFYLSTGIGGRGYGCFVDNVWRLRFDIGKTRKNELTWTAPGGPIDYYIINGPSFKSIINQYTQLTGRPTMLPLAAFGYWQSRCFFNNFADIQKTVTRLEAGGFPLDILVIDSNWPEKEVDFHWSQNFLSGRTAQDWIADLHAGGATVMLSTKGPMIRTDAENYKEALSKGLFATDGRGNPLTAGYYGGQLLDFTHPEIENWLSTQLKPLSKQGIDCWWLDLIEPEGEPPQAVYYKGKSADIHNTFPLLNYRAYFDYQRSIAPNARPLILGRAASAGTQRYSGVVWTGDIKSDWPTFQAHIPEAQNSGLSGLPYWTNDSGGFIGGFLNNDRYGAHAELYERWFEFTTFAPIMRTHKAGPSEPYEYGPEVEATAKKYAQLRYRLLPYIYTTAWEATATGLPMLRPLVLEYQTDPGSANAKTEFLFGSDMLVAPVLWPNATSRQVYFPPGRWISYDDGFETTGGASFGVAAPRDYIPLFVRAGAILPTAPAMMSSGEKLWDPITLEVWPAGTSDNSLYQDDGKTTAYSSGEYTLTRFQCVERAGKSLTFAIEPSNQKFGPQQWITKFHLTSVPTKVTLDGQSLPLTSQQPTRPHWDFDARSYLLTVTLPGNHAAHKLSILLDGSSHPHPPLPKVDVPLISDTLSPTVKQLPQFLPAPKLPTRIEAANFDKGGEGLAFHIASPGKTSLYRQEGVPIIASTDEGGGYAVPDMKSGDWLAYTVDAGEGGWFALSARVRPFSSGKLLFARNRIQPLSSIEIPGPSGSATTWLSIAGQSLFYLPSGEQVLTARIIQPGFQLGNFTFTKAKNATIVVEAESGTLLNVKTDTDHPGYQGTGFVAGLRGKASSITIPINVPLDGKYLVALRYANGEGIAELALRFAQSQNAIVSLPPTNDWNSYDEAGVLLELKAGPAELSILGTDVGVVNIDQIKLIPVP